MGPRAADRGASGERLAAQRSEGGRALHGTFNTTAGSGRAERTESFETFTVTSTGTPAARIQAFLIQMSEKHMFALEIQ